jgi:23S rRNA (adenine2503-C2)-methyltransferase
MEPRAPAQSRPSLLAAFLDGQARRELGARQGGLEAYRITQIARRLCAGASSFDEMTDLPKALRRELAGAYALRETAVVGTLASGDGTIKQQIRLADGVFIEAVLLADGSGRRTACLSTQAGCPAGCVFCKTGSIGFIRNLSGAEIAEQFFHLRDALRNAGAAGAPDAASDGGAASGTGVSTIVVMGMGEPLFNLDELQKALLFLGKTGGSEPRSPRRITVSTGGIVAGIRALPAKLEGVRLAVSLTTADEALRRRLMPVAETNPLPDLKEALRYYQSREKKRITLEAVLLGGVNTRAEDAAAMAAFARDLKVIVNLIPWNPVDGLRFEGRPLREPANGEAERFAALLHRHGLKTALRRHKGRRVCGACGQLGGPLRG